MLVLGEVELANLPKVLVLGVPLGCLFRGVPLWSLGRWGQGDEGVAARLWQIPAELRLLGGS